MNQIKGGARLEKVRLIDAEYGLIKICIIIYNNNSINGIKTIIGRNRKLVSAARHNGQSGLESIKWSCSSIIVTKPIPMIPISKIVTMINVFKFLIIA